MSLLSAAIRRGTHSARPTDNSAGTEGRLYYETDTETLFRDNGATWDSVEGGGASGLTSTLLFTLDGGGSAITTGIKGDLVIDFACTIDSVTLLADQSGSLVVDIWKQSYASYPPTVTQTITASAKPTLSSALKSQNTTLTGWTTTITAGDVLRFNVDSCATITRCLVALKVTRT